MSKPSAVSAAGLLLIAAVRLRRRPGSIVANPNPLTLGAAVSDANYIVSLTLSREKRRANS